MIVLDNRRAVSHVRHRVVNMRRWLVRIAVVIHDAATLLAIRGRHSWVLKVNWLKTDQK